MNIPDAAVEAAAEVLRAADKNKLMARDHESPRAHYLRKTIMLKALVAAAPHLMAEALEEAAKSFSACSPEGEYSSTPEQVITWMQEYAEAYRAAGAGNE